MSENGSAANCSCTDRGTILARRQDHLRSGAESGRPESLRVFVLLSKRRQSIPVGGTVILFQLVGEAEPEFLSQRVAALRSILRGRRLDGNLRAEHENAVAMPERTNQIIPVPLFHSSSTGDSATAMLIPGSLSRAMLNLGRRRYSWDVRMRCGDSGFNRGFHSTSRTRANPQPVSFPGFFCTRAERRGPCASAQRSRRAVRSRGWLGATDKEAPVHMM